MAEQHEEEAQISCSFVTKLPAELRVPAAPIVSAACCSGPLPIIGCWLRILESPS